ncbi:MAG: hypothetical protein EBY22_13360 [Gammaproteobacteria bacterium]|nr:hypothetical protein [Gammaproteobacteria bacterium]
MDDRVASYLHKFTITPHINNIANSSTATGLQFNGFSEDDLSTIRKALADKAQSGKSIASLVAGVQAL